ncbi:MAG: MerR family transcriptional regulator, partial [Roseburia sp.]|nr:MerR family transcriptional regulator [Roseburia sp.]
MDEKTLREVCETLHVSRRAIQGYEKEGLLKPSGKNERGWLLYDTECQEQIKRLKFYQDIGLKVKEIKELLVEPVEIQRLILHRQQEQLRRDI